MGRVSTCQKNCNTIDLRRAQVNETLDEIKTSLENLWQEMIQLSEFFQYSFVLILKRKCLVRASQHNRPAQSAGQWNFGWN